ncbi:uncharacterized protein LOC131845917 [Achroia grisella]|uniref:uncharacterized protein LOC131845917 n=1 Tax=Achroia grisella TaxID=688607 RepID=UPI0027D2C43F|nr:uncharacterized protein LOC131845917 [Achroia grisella]
MQSATFVLLLAVVTMAVAEGHYTTLSQTAHGGADSNANANAEANSGGDNVNTNANARTSSGSGGWGLPSLSMFSGSNPNILSFGQTRRQSGPVYGARSISPNSSVGLDS